MSVLDVAPTAFDFAAVVVFILFVFVVVLLWYEAQLNSAKNAHARALQSGWHNFNAARELSDQLITWDWPVYGMSNHSVRVAVLLGEPYHVVRETPAEESSWRA